MSVFAWPVVVIFTVLTFLAFALVVRRLLGQHFSIARTLVAGLLAFLVAQPIIASIDPELRHSDDVLPGLWFVLLGTVCALLAGMVFLVVAEALVPSGSLPGPLFLVRGLRKRLRRTRRYLQITRIVMRHHLTPYLRGGRRAELTTADGRARLARSVRFALDDGGVTFVKLGQVLSTRRDLLPAEFVDELGRLQDEVTPVPWPDIERVLSAELGAPVEEVFAEFDREPLAAASIAQVHAATLASGERVVVKVCRPDVGAVVEWDLDILGRLARTLQRRTRWGRGIGAPELARGFAESLREELDLRNEVQNLFAVAAARGADDGIRVPLPYEQLCTRQVLVMQRLDGRSISTAPEDPELARRLLDSLLRQVMLDGVFHVDPHPGNILLLDDGAIGLLDFGSVGRIDAGLRSSLQRLVMAIDRGDPLALSDALLEVVDRPAELDELHLERALGQFMVRHLGPGIAPDARMFADLLRVVAEHGLAVPPEIAAVFRALATLEGTLTQLAPGFDTVAEARNFAQSYFADQLHPGAIRQAAQDELAVLLPMLRRLPRRIDRITTALEQGRLGMNVSLLADERDRRTITGMLHQVLITVLAATTGIMAVLMLGLRGGPSMTANVSLYQFFGYCLLVISAILALRVLAVVFSRVDQNG